MAPGSHLMMSWLGSAQIFYQRRERVLVTLSGVLPDIDGFGIIIDKITGVTNLYYQYHHYLGHNIFSAMFFSTLLSFIAKNQKVKVFLFSFFLIHLHITCDVIGSKGPDGYHWPIYYFYPLDSSLGLTWKYQWELSSWPNTAITISLFLLCTYDANRKKFSFLEVFSQRLDREAFAMYQRYILKR
ncbi:metal-dependent hydrolase [Aliikangiella sp. IMCC44359]|uniref:metal-dependent hydrolase n=1 Tax=Aliikangiella sp. IMCC44359 TaxID=3459125 RepID=UPI00403A98F6